MIEFVLPYPISSNDYWGTRVVKAKGSNRMMALTYVTHEARDYKKLVAAAARAAGITKPIPGRYAMHLKLYPHRPQDWQTRQRKLGELWDDDVRCIDLGNCEKVLSDAMEDIVFVNDKFARRIVLDRMEPDGGPARVVGRVLELGTAQPALPLTGGGTFEEVFGAF